MITLTIIENHPFYTVAVGVAIIMFFIIKDLLKGEKHNHLHDHKRKPK